MKLLIVTQVVDKNDSVLGFMHGWIAEFARNVDELTVICLKKGEHYLPDNVKVVSLGKEGKRSRIQYILRFYNYVWSERVNYDTVFVHMNPIYIVLGGLLWQLLSKKIALWYTHKHVDLKLRVAEKMADIILTASRESFRLTSKKVKVMGHGINIDAFNPSVKEKDSVFTILTIGRISPIKDYETLIEAANLLVQKGLNIKVIIVGGAGTPEQVPYEQSLKKLVAEKKLGDTITFVGPLPNTQIVSFLERAHVFVNTSGTGSLDKSGLEAMACGLPVITCNESYVDMLQSYGYMFEKGNAQALSKKIEDYMKKDKETREKVSVEMRDLVVKNHALQSLIPKIVTTLGNL